MIKLGQFAEEIAEESLVKLENLLAEMDPNKVLRQDSVRAEFTVSELIKSLDNVRGIYEIDFTYIYSDDSTDEDLTEIEGLDSLRMEFSVDEEIAEGPMEYIYEFVEMDVLDAVIEEHNTLVGFNLADSEEEN